MENYAIPDVLVSTEWVNEHKNDPNIAIVEVDVDTTAYEEGHVPGALGWNWKNQLCDTLQRDIISKENLEKLMSEGGISNETTIILYGDNNKWFAAWAFWQLKIYGHENIKIMNGGRKKWLEEGHELSKEIPTPTATQYQASEPNNNLRAMLPQVQETHNLDSYALVDVRSGDEFTGKVLSPPGLEETCQRGGHIPGAKNIPWGLTCNEDGTFKTAAALQELYESKGVSSDKNIIAYCRIGERSSHSWFVLKYLLGYENVSNYDGSWTEWGNLVGAEVEK